MDQGIREQKRQFILDNTKHAKNVQWWHRREKKFINSNLRYKINYSLKLVH